MSRERIDSRYTCAVHVSTPFNVAAGATSGEWLRIGRCGGVAGMATGERTQMRAVESVSGVTSQGRRTPAAGRRARPGASRARRRPTEPASAGSRRQDRRCSRRVTSASGKRDCSCSDHAHCAAVAAVASSPTIAKFGRRDDEVRAAGQRAQMRLQAIGAVQGIARQVVDARERVVCQRRRSPLRQRQQAGGVSAALVVRAVRGNPLGDDPESSPRGGPACSARRLEVLFLAGAEVGAEAPIGLPRQVARPVRRQSRRRTSRARSPWPGSSASAWARDAAARAAWRR